MKPFDLEGAKRGEPVVTRDGRKVIDLYHFEHDKSDMCLCVHIEGEASPDWFRTDGQKYRSEDSPDDLFMAPQKKTMYVNVYVSRLNTVRNHGNISAAFDTEAGARDNAKGNGVPLIAVAVPVEIEV